MKFSPELADSIIKSYHALHEQASLGSSSPLKDPEEEKRNVEELNRYLIIRARIPHEKLPPPAAVDEFWHAFLAMSDYYYRFCEETFGFVVHHDPFVQVMSDSADVNPLTMLVEIEESEKKGERPIYEMSQTDRNKYGLYLKELDNSVSTLGYYPEELWFGECADCG